MRQLSEKPPPRIGRLLLKLLIWDIESEALQGDFDEIYKEQAERKGVFIACLWYWCQILLLIPRVLKESIISGVSMIKNYMKISFRNVKKHKGYSFINLAGLSIGMTCFILILLFVRNELSFDRFHEKADGIYRIVLENDHFGEAFHMAPTMLPLAPALLKDFAEIPHATRVSQKSSNLCSFGDKQFYERLIFADPDFFNIFTFPLLKGDPNTVLSEPYSVVITENIARKYFGNQNPLGQTIKVNNSTDFKITGILDKIPDNSHFRFAMLASFASLKNVEKERLNNWTSFSNDYTYIFLPDSADPSVLERKFPAFLKKYLNPQSRREHKLHLQPLRDIHFSSLNYDFARTYNKNYLYAFSVVGFFILLIACINFMNLTTARSSRRAKEVGLRKVVGAKRIQIIRQFLAESIFMALSALVISVLLVSLLLPGYSRFLNRELTFNIFRDLALLGTLLCISLFVGIVSGSYPAFFLSAFSPIRVLRGTIASTRKRVSFRAVLVILQFAISIVLIISTLMVFKQINFMKNKDLGFTEDQMVVIPLQNSAIAKNPEVFKTELLHNPLISSASISSGAPGSGSSRGSSYQADNSGGEDREIYLKILYTDYDFFKTLDLKIISGRSFSREFSTDIQQAYILNETAVKELGWENPIGKRLSENSDEPGYVIGVVRDFHYDSAQFLVEPMVITIKPSRYEYIQVKLRPDNIAGSLAFLESKWHEFAPQYPFEHYFMDTEFESNYYFEQRLGVLFTYFSLLAVFISCLGVFGLIAFTAERNTKEIGIRKVLGASLAGIVLLLTKQFVKWVLIANIVAWPVAYFAMNKWLQNFAYRTSIDIWIFMLSAALAVVIALITISYQSIKAGKADPAKALRYE